MKKKKNMCVCYLKMQFYFSKKKCGWLWWPNSRMQNQWIWRAALQADDEQRPSDAHVQDTQRMSCWRALFKLGSKLTHTPISPVTLHAGKLKSLKNRQIKEKRQRVTTFWKWEHGFDKCKSLFFYLILKVTWEHHRKTQIWGTLSSL